LGIEHLSAVFDHAGRGGSHLVILLVVASYSDQRGEWIADQATLQKRARLGRRRVQQLLDDLVAAGELAVLSGDGRGKCSTFRLTISGPAERAQRTAPLTEKGAAEYALSPQKGEAECALSAPKGAPQTALSHPPCPPFPPDPQSPLNPPEKLETYGLHPGSPELVSPLPAGREGDGRGAGGEAPFSPLPFGEGGGGTHGRGAGGEGSEAEAPPEIRPLTPAQTPVFRVHLLLEEAAVPLPTPSQIGLWCKTLGGIEPLLDLLRQLIEAGLATKREPIVYAHRVVMERAAHPQPAPRAAGHAAGRAAHRELLRTAGVDDVRRAQAARIAEEEDDE
jgi:hypothetical protein